MRIQLMNRRAQNEAAAASYDDNIFLNIKDPQTPKAITPKVPVAARDIIEAPTQFQCFEDEKIQSSTPAHLRGVGCISASGKVMTSRGAKSVGELAIGDLVLTRDNGFQPVRWVGEVEGKDAVPSMIRIESDTVEVGVPDEALVVSGRQKILLSCASSAKQFGVQEVFVRAADLLHMEGVNEVATEDAPKMTAILLDQHQVLRVNNTWTESLRPDSECLSHLNKEAHEAIEAVLPNLKKLPIERSYAAARSMLRSTFARQFSREQI